MFRSFHDIILYWDNVLWYYLNTQWHNAFLDFVMPFVRNQWFWVPVYFFLAVYMPTKYRKTGIIWCAFFIVSFIISDQLSATVMKPFFHRVRPCNNNYLTGIVHIIVPCGAGKSFPSTHAANHFSIGMFMAMTLGRYVKWVWPASLLWAALVCYAQVYVGVHYPLDVLCGGMLGMVAGYTMGHIFNNRWPLQSKPAAAPPEIA